MINNFADIAFTEGVKKIQEQNGSRSSYEKMSTVEKTLLYHREIEFIKSIDGFFMATVNESGWPYVQFRGGSKGFLKVINQKQLAFADFRGNMQYISVGNINSTGKASLFLIDYTTQQRLKIWAESKVLSAGENPELVKTLEVPGYGAQIERLIIFKILAFDWNCRQHISDFHLG